MKSEEKLIIRSGSGIGFCGLLTILFIGLKLTGNIMWPWLWVLSPLWVPLAAVAAFVAIVFALCLILKLIDVMTGNS